MKIKSFAPSSDWYFVFVDSTGKTVNYRLAGYAIVEDDDGKTDSVVGMVPVSGGGNDNVMPGVCRLATVPPVTGTYKHRSEISEA
jgi:hypothetical protein